MEKSHYPEMFKALRALKINLGCSVCGNLAHNTTTLGGCDHIFCRECCMDHLGNACPVCGIPAYVKDAKVNRQLSNMVSLCAQLERVLQAKSQEGSPSQTSTGLVMDSSGSVKRIESSNTEAVVDKTGETDNIALETASVTKPCDPASVYDFISSPNSHTSSPGVRAKKNLRKLYGRKKPVKKADKRKRAILEDDKGKHSSESDAENVCNPGKSTLKQGSSCNFLKRQKLSAKKQDSLRKKNVVHNLRNSRHVSGHLHNSSNNPKGFQSPVPSKRIPNLSNFARSPVSLLKKNAKGETPLHVATIKDDMSHVKSLLQDGADPNVRDNAGWTPLHEACNLGHDQVAELLLNNGALINIPGMSNDSPLHDAVMNYRLDCVKLLVSRGASQTVRNIHGYCPCDYANTNDMKQALSVPVETQPSVTTISGEENGLMEMSNMCMLGTALSRSQCIIMQKCATLLNAEVVQEMCPEVTHVVTSCNLDGQCPRTIKFLQALFGGKWIVNMEWVNVCMEYGVRVSEEAFEVPGCSNNPDTFAACKSRLNQREQLPGLFDGIQFYFHGTFEHPTPEKTELADLVKRGSGRVLSREPRSHIGHSDRASVPYHGRRGSALDKCHTYIIHDSRILYPAVRTTYLCSAPVSWLMDCMATFTIQELPSM